MKRVIPRVRFLTIASDGVGVPWSLSLLLRTFRTLHDLEHLTVATIEPISQTQRHWDTINAICGSGKAYDSLGTVEFYFGSPRPASSAEYISREELGEKLPYLAEHGMLKVSDPNVYVSHARLFLAVLTASTSQRDGLDAILTCCAIFSSVALYSWCTRY